MVGTSGTQEGSSESKKTGPDVASASGLSVALSAIVAAIWVGIWGFDWAATHLSEGDLYVAILVGLGGGIALTIYAIERTFWAVRSALGTWKEVAIEAINKGRPIPSWPGGIVSVRVVSEPAPRSDPSGGSNPRASEAGEECFDTDGT
jgi:hypothetical protein